MSRKYLMIFLLGIIFVFSFTKPLKAEIKQEQTKKDEVLMNLGSSCASSMIEDCVSSCVSSVCEEIFKILPTKIVKASLGPAVQFEGVESLNSNVAKFEFLLGGGFGFEANEKWELLPELQFGMMTSDQKYNALGYFSLSGTANYFPNTINDPLYFTGEVAILNLFGRYEDYLVSHQNLYTRFNLGVGCKIINQLRLELTYNLFAGGASLLQNELTGANTVTRLKNYFSLNILFGQFTTPKAGKVEEQPVVAVEE